MAFFSYSLRCPKFVKEIKEKHLELKSNSLITFILSLFFFNRFSKKGKV